MTIPSKTHKFVLLKGKKHGNIFWTTFYLDDSYDDYEILYKGNTSEEMIAEWNKAWLNQYKNRY